MTDLNESMSDLEKSISDNNNDLFSETESDDSVMEAGNQIDDTYLVFDKDENAEKVITEEHNGENAAEFVTVLVYVQLKRRVKMTKIFFCG